MESRLTNQIGTLDAIDRKILALLQEDATIALADLSRAVGLSPTPCWKRVQKLDKAAVITGRVALLDPRKIGLSLTVFVSIETDDHSQPWLARFAAAVYPEAASVLEVSR